jgi:hypothetical protein
MVVIKVDNGKTVIIVAKDKAVAANLVIDVDGMVANLDMVNYKNLGGQVSVRVR